MYLIFYLIKGGLQFRNTNSIVAKPIYTRYHYTINSNAIVIVIENGLITTGRRPNL